MKGVFSILIIAVGIVSSVLAFEGSWNLIKIQDQQIAIKNPVKFHISLQIVEDPNGSGNKLVRNKLEVQGCVAFTYLFKTLGSNFYLDISSYKFLKDKSRECTQGENSLMMFIYKSIKQVFKIQTNDAQFLMKSVGNENLFSLAKDGLKKVEEALQTPSIIGLWQIYKVNKIQTGLRFLVNISDTQIPVCSDKVKIKYSLKPGGLFQISINQTQYQNNKKECSNQQNSLVKFLKIAKKVKKSGKFAALFDDTSSSPLIEMKDISQNVIITQNKVQTSVQKIQKEKSVAVVSDLFKPTQITVKTAQKIAQNTVISPPQKIVEKVSNISQVGQKVAKPTISQQPLTSKQKISAQIIVDVKKQQQIQTIKNQKQQQNDKKQTQVIANSIRGKWYPKTVYNIPPPPSEVFLLVNASQIIINGCNIHVFPYTIVGMVNKETKTISLKLDNPISTKKACFVDDDTLFLRAMRMVKTATYETKNNQLIFKDSSERIALLLTKIEQKKQVKQVKQKKQNNQIKQNAKSSTLTVQAKSQEIKLDRIDSPITNTVKQVKQLQKEVVKPIENKQKNEVSRVLPEGNFISMLLMNRAASRLYIKVERQNKLLLKGKCGQFSLNIAFSGQKIVISENSKMKDECQNQKEYMQNLYKCEDFQYNQSQGIVLLKDKDGNKLVWMKNIK